MMSAGGADDLATDSARRNRERSIGERVIAAIVYDSMQRYARLRVRSGRQTDRLQVLEETARFMRALTAAAPLCYTATQTQTLTSRSGSEHRKIAAGQSGDFHFAAVMWP